MPDLGELVMSSRMQRRHHEHEATIGSLGLTAAAFDEFGLCELLGRSLGKCGSHVAVDTPKLVKALCMQAVAVPHQSMSGTGEFYDDRPAGILLGCPGVTGDELNREVLSRMLDEVYAAGPDRLHTQCAGQVAERLGISPRICHIDSTSFTTTDGPAPRMACP